MKQLFTLASFAALATCAHATTWTITCQNGSYHFLPVTMNANVGDTIHWSWVSGNHIVGPIAASDIPAGASMWYGDINSTQQTFDYVLTVAGNYYYVCHPAAPHGEDGYLVVGGATSVQHTEPTDHGTLLFPIPFNDHITIETSGANNVVLHNLLGETVAAFTLTNGGMNTVSGLGALPKGIYFCSLLRNGQVVGVKRVVK